MPQMRPMYWTIIIITLITFLSVTSSNIPKTNKNTNQKKDVNLTKKTIKW